MINDGEESPHLRVRGRSTAAVLVGEEEPPLCHAWHARYRLCMSLLSCRVRWSTDTG